MTPEEEIRLCEEDLREAEDEAAQARARIAYLRGSGPWFGQPERTTQGPVGTRGHVNDVARRLLVDACARAENDALAAARESRNVADSHRSHLVARALSNDAAARYLRDLLGVPHDVDLFPGNADRHHLDETIKAIRGAP